MLRWVNIIIMGSVFLPLSVAHDRVWRPPAKAVWRFREHSAPFWAWKWFQSKSSFSLTASINQHAFKKTVFQFEPLTWQYPKAGFHKSFKKAESRLLAWGGLGPQIRKREGWVQASIPLRLSPRVPWGPGRDIEVKWIGANGEVVWGSWQLLPHGPYAHIRFPEDNGGMIQISLKDINSSEVLAMAQLQVDNPLSWISLILTPLKLEPIDTVSSTRLNWKDSIQLVHKVPRPDGLEMAQIELASQEKLKIFRLPKSFGIQTSKGIPQSNLLYPSGVDLIGILESKFSKDNSFYQNVTTLTIVGQKEYHLASHDQKVQPYFLTTDGNWIRPFEFRLLSLSEGIYFIKWMSSEVGTFLAKFNTPEINLLLPIFIGKQKMAQGFRIESDLLKKKWIFLKRLRGQSLMESFAIDPSGRIWFQLDEKSWWIGSNSQLHNFLIHWDQKQFLTFEDVHKLLRQQRVYVDGLNEFIWIWHHSDCDFEMHSLVPGRVVSRFYVKDDLSIQVNKSDRSIATLIYPVDLDDVFVYEDNKKFVYPMGVPAQQGIFMTACLGFDFEPIE